MLSMPFTQADPFPPVWKSCTKLWKTCAPTECPRRCMRSWKMSAKPMSNLALTSLFNILFHFTSRSQAIGLFLVSKRFFSFRVFWFSSNTINGACCQWSLKFSFSLILLSELLWFYYMQFIMITTDAIYKDNCYRKILQCNGKEICRELLKWGALSIDKLIKEQAPGAGNSWNMLWKGLVLACYQWGLLSLWHGVHRACDPRSLHP